MAWGSVFYNSLILIYNFLTYNSSTLIYNSLILIYNSLILIFSKTFALVLPSLSDCPHWALLLLALHSQIQPQAFCTLPLTCISCLTQTSSQEANLLFKGRVVPQRLYDRLPPLVIWLHPSAQVEPHGIWPNLYLSLEKISVHLSQLLVLDQNRPVLHRTEQARLGCRWTLFDLCTSMNYQKKFQSGKLRWKISFILRIYFTVNGDNMCQCWRVQRNSQHFKDPFELSPKFISFGRARLPWIASQAF